MNQVKSNGDVSNTAGGKSDPDAGLEVGGSTASEFALWINHRNENLAVRIVGESTIRSGFVMIQKMAAQGAHGVFGVAPGSLIRSAQ